MDEVRSQVKSLRNLVSSLYSFSVEQVWATIELERGEKSRKNYHLDNRLNTKEYLVHGVKEFVSGLPEFEIDEEIEHEFDNAEWSLGREFKVMEPREIVGGFLMPVLDVPVIRKVSLEVFAFLTISGCKDLLDRHLQQGIHYHYALADKSHTTTMICWDQRWVSPLKGDQQMRPLFHELHAQGAKSKRARPEIWGDRKRKSIRKACEPDLRKWPINAFRCASNGSSAVWPIGATLTPKLLQHVKSRSKNNLSKA
nr:hypothetical protein [Amylibacter sp.]